jgi:hypothetical protein
MNEDAKFSCTACHIAPSEDKDKAMTSCRKCGKLHCPDCLDEFGRCVACNEDEDLNAD